MRFKVGVLALNISAHTKEAGDMKNSVNALKMFFRTLTPDEFNKTLAAKDSVLTGCKLNILSSLKSESKGTTRYK